MSWKDAVMASATAAARERTRQDTPIFSTAQSMGWDPHDVWLTRVREPRMIATSAAGSTARRISLAAETGAEPSAVGPFQTVV